MINPTSSSDSIPPEHNDDIKSIEVTNPGFKLWQKSNKTGKDISTREIRKVDDNQLAETSEDRVKKTRQRY